MVRLKSRYLLMEMKFEDGLVHESINAQALYHNLMNCVQMTHGDFGVGCVKPSFRVKHINPYTGVVFIKCSRDYYRLLWQAITFAKQVNGKACSFKTLHIGGTIKSCQRWLIQHNKDQLIKMLAQCKTPAEKEKLSNIMARLPTVESRLTPAEVRKRRQNELEWKHLNSQMT